jgi:hypothetical protein
VNLEKAQQKLDSLQFERRRRDNFKIHLSHQERRIQEISTLLRLSTEECEKCITLTAEYMLSTHLLRSNKNANYNS